MVSLTTSCAERRFHSAKQSAVPLGQEIKTTLAWNIPKGGTREETYQFPNILATISLRLCPY